MRHLEALRDAARRLERGEEGFEAARALFESEAWRRCSASTVATSHLTSPMLWGSAFAPADRYGLSYNVHPGHVNVTVTACGAEHPALELVGALREAFARVGALLAAS